MESPAQDTIEIEKQSHRSIILIAAILIMTALYMTCTYNSEDEGIMLCTLVCPIFSILAGMYTFTYTGKAYAASRIIFYISLALSLCSIFVLCFFIELANTNWH